MDILIKRYPEEQLAETKTSELVDIVTDPPNVAMDPIVKPIIVTLMYTPATISPDFTSTTMRESVLGPEMAVAVPLKETLVGVTPEAKNPDGYINVIVLEADSAPPALGVKPNVTGTPGLLTTRSLFAMLNATLVTAPPIQPEAVLSEETSS
jgi:hypothetical protein